MRPRERTIIGIMDSVRRAREIFVEQRGVVVYELCEWTTIMNALMASVAVPTHLVQPAVISSGMRKGMELL